MLSRRLVLLTLLGLGLGILARPLAFPGPGPRGSWSGGYQPNIGPDPPYNDTTPMYPGPSFVALGAAAVFVSGFIGNFLGLTKFGAIGLIVGAIGIVVALVYQSAEEALKGKPDPQAILPRISDEVKRYMDNVVAGDKHGVEKLQTAGIDFANRLALPGGIFAPDSDRLQLWVDIVTEAEKHAVPGAADGSRTAEEERIIAQLPPHLVALAEGKAGL